MSLREILHLDTLRDGADKSNYSDEWLRDLIRGSVSSGYEEDFVSLSTWVVNHNLNTDVLTYLCVDDGSPPTQIFPTSMEINNSNRITLYFAAPTTGSVKIMFGFSGWVYPAQSQVGYPSDGNWDDGVTNPGKITATTSIADAIDYVNQAAHAVPPVAGGNNLQGAYDKAGPPAGNEIYVDLAKPIVFRTSDDVPGRDVLHIIQTTVDGTGYPLLIDNQKTGADYSIKLSGSTRIIGSDGATLKLVTETSGNILFDSAAHIVAELGDDAGVRSFQVRDSLGATVFSVSSNGDSILQGKLEAYGITDTKFYGFEPVASEVDSPLERPQLYVDSANSHLMYVDGAGLAFDISQSLFYSYMVEDVFEITPSIISLGYIDLASTPIANSEFVYMNGICLTKDTLSDTWDYKIGYGADPPYRIRFDPLVTLVEGKKIAVKYIIDFSLESLADEVFIVTAPVGVGPWTYPLSHSPINNSEFVMLNGVTLTYGSGYDYTISGSDLIINATVELEDTDKIHVKYKYT